jgi:hypothetical protein
MRTATTRVLLLLSFTLLVSACMAHDKAGDQAAALGDWKTAYVNYREALADAPTDPKLKEKYDRARAEALKAATSAARACIARREWACAVNEAEFALSIEPGNTELSAIRRDAGLQQALLQVEQARGQVARGQLRQGDATLRDAQRLSNDPKVLQAISQVAGVLVTAAVAESDRLRAARQFPEALAVLQLALPYEASLRERIEGVKREQAAFLRAEHDRLMTEGEQLLARNAWSDAAARFQAASAALPDERARACERYARLALSADAAVERGDWPAATRGYQAMVELRVEQNGYAAAQLGRVTIRPWAIRLRSVLVTPLRPDGVPWVGRPSRAAVRVANEVVRLGGGSLSVPFLLMLNELPNENQPTVAIEVTAPGGPPLVSQFHRGLYSTLGASVVVGANAFERRKVFFRVFHDERGAPPETMGIVEVPIGELVTRGRLVIQSESVPALELTAEPADGVAIGSFSDLSPAPPPLPPGPGPRDRPAPGR